MTVTAAVPDSVPSSGMSARPPRRERGFMPNEPIVLLHGFHHGAWAWTEVIAEPAGRGRSAVAVDIAAHGLHATAPAAAGQRPFDPVAYATEPSPVSGVGLDAAADLLVAQLESVGGGTQVCVVAHSMGGRAEQSSGTAARTRRAHGVPGGVHAGLEHAVPRLPVAARGP